MNQWVMVVSTPMLVNWALQKKREGIVAIFQSQTCSDRHWGGPRPLLQGHLFRPPGDRVPGGIRLHCAGLGEPGRRSAWQRRPSAHMSAHSEKALLDSDGKSRKRRQEKENLCTKSRGDLPHHCRFFINTLYQHLLKQTVKDSARNQHKTTAAVCSMTWVAMK